MYGQFTCIEYSFTHQIPTQHFRGQEVLLIRNYYLLPCICAPGDYESELEEQGLYQLTIQVHHLGQGQVLDQFLR